MCEHRWTVIQQLTSSEKMLILSGFRTPPVRTNRGGAESQQNHPCKIQEEAQGKPPVALFTYACLVTVPNKNFLTLVWFTYACLVTKANFLVTRIVGIMNMYLC